MSQDILQQILDQEPHDQWHYNEFLGLLLVYAGKADGDFSDDEKAHVISQVGNEVFDKADKYLEESDDLDQVTMIMVLFDYYAQDEEKKKYIFDTLKDMLMADGVIDYSEQKLLESYKFLFE